MTLRLMGRKQGDQLRAGHELLRLVETCRGKQVDTR